MPDQPVLAAGTAFTWPDGTERTAKRDVTLQELLQPHFGRRHHEPAADLTWTRATPSAPGVYCARAVLSERAKAEQRAPRMVELVVEANGLWVRDTLAGGWARPAGYEWWPVRVSPAGI